MSYTVEERLHRIEQAFERAVGIKLHQFDPDPAVAAATPETAPVEAPVEVAPAADAESAAPAAPPAA